MILTATNTDNALNDCQSYDPTQTADSLSVAPVDLHQHMKAVADEVGKLPDPLPAEQPIDETDPNGFRAFGEKIRIRPGQKVPPPPVCLSFQQNGKSEVFGTLGNFSVAIGKAKSRKTTAISIIIASALKPSSSDNQINGSFPDDKKVVLYFDTEQGEYHMTNVVDRICKLCEQPTPDNLLVYPLRGESASYVRAFIEWQIYNTPNVGLVVIDGIRDTVTDINDSNQASERATDLLRWSKDRNIHIITVIHVNKGNDSIRGALGTELQNKAETVAVISVDTSDKNISIISPSETRNKAFEPVAFSIDENGLPFLIDDVPNSFATSTGISKQSTKDASVEEVNQIVRRAFIGQQYVLYTALRTNIQEAAKFIGKALGKNKTEELIRRLVVDGSLIKFRPTNEKWDAYKLNQDKIPF